MKDFIKNRLRLVLEGSKATHTPSNPVGIDPSIAKDDDLQRTIHKIIQLQQQHGNDPYFQDTHEGDGIYMATVHTNGHVTIKTPNPKRKLDDGDIGLMWTGPRGNKHVYVKAYRGISHPEYDDDIRQGQTRLKSPADDAATKVYLVFAQEILNFVKQHMEGEDDYTTDSDDKDFKSKTMDKWQYKYDKLEKEKERKRKSQITMSPEDKEEYEKAQQALRDKYDKLRQRRK